MPGTVQSPPWRERKVPSVLVFIVLLLVVALITVALAVRLKSSLSHVGRDRVGTDPWTNSIGVMKTKSGFLVAQVPECAQAPVERIALWDGNSKPLWEVAGPAVPMPAFVIGVAPPGFKTIHPYHQSPASTLLRLVVVRRLAGVV